MSESFNPFSFAQSLQSLNLKKDVPPVDQWNPSYCGEIELKIDKNGVWYYQNSSIRRPALVRLFASVLRKDVDGHYYLVTPVEKLRIQVEDAPFLVIQMYKEDSKINFVTNVGDSFELDQAHTLRVESCEKGEPRPYVHVRAGLDALISRAVFYQLVELAEAVVKSDRVEYQLFSAGNMFVLGSIDSNL